MRRTVAENLVPGRMVFLDFVLAPDGLRWIGATGAAGRAKPSVVESGLVGFVRYEVFDRAGLLVVTGSVPDPTRRRLEHPTTGDEGKITATMIFSDEGMLAVRLPGETNAARIVFSRDPDPQALTAKSNGANRERLGEFLLQPGP